MATDFAGPLYKQTPGRQQTPSASLARAADIIVTLTAEDADSLAPLSPASAKLALPPGYNGPRAQDRQIGQATPRCVVIVGAYRWTPKQMNLSAFLEAADPILQDAGIGIDVVGEMPESLRQAWEVRVKATRFHGFVENLGEFLAARRMGLVVELTGGGFKLKTLDYIFNRVPIAAIRGSIAGLPLTPGLHYLSYKSMRELAQGIAAVIDDLARLNSMQQAAYERCNAYFDWSDRGRILCNAIRRAENQQRAALQGEVGTMNAQWGVSIIVVNFNYDRFLAAAIDSALGQEPRALRGDRCRRLLDRQFTRHNCAIRKSNSLCSPREKRRSDCCNE